MSADAIAGVARVAAPTKVAVRATVLVFGIGLVRLLVGVAILASVLDEQ